MEGVGSRDVCPAEWVGPRVGYEGSLFCTGDVFLSFGRESSSTQQAQARGGCTGWRVSGRVFFMDELNSTQCWLKASDASARRLAFEVGLLVLLPAARRGKES